MSDFEWVAAAVVAVMSSARITRLFVWDTYPPVAWLRSKWDDLTHESEWNQLFHCGYCFGLWSALVVVPWGYFTDFHWTWWLVNGWLGVGYLAAIVMAFDGED